jgi:hypothetical protein
MRGPRFEFCLCHLSPIRTEQIFTSLDTVFSNVTVYHEEKKELTLEGIPHPWD